MSAIEVRPLAADEWRVWRDMRLRALADAPDAFAVTLADSAAKPDDEWRDSVGRTAASPRGDSLIAYVDGHPAGMGYVGVGDDGIGHVFAMWVAPEHRRRGVASALLVSMKSFAAGVGAATLRLWATLAIDGVAALYRSAGFVEDGELEPLRPGSEVMIVPMKHDL